MKKIWKAVSAFLVLSLALMPATARAQAMDAAVAPQITAHPAHANINAGEEARFEVTAAGEGLSYQWQATSPYYGEAEWDGGELWVDLVAEDGVEGVTTAAIALPASLTEEYYNVAFRCIVTNSAGSVISETAILTVEGAWPALEAVAGVPVGVYMPIGRGKHTACPLVAMVTVPNNVASLSASDFAVDFGVKEGIYNGDLYSNGGFAPESRIDSVELAVGMNDIYFKIVLVEIEIHYRVAVTREGGGTSSGESSGSAPQAGTENGTSPSAGGDVPAAPQTGDDGGGGLWFAVLAASVLALPVMAALYGRRQGESL